MSYTSGGQKWVTSYVLIIFAVITVLNYLCPQSKRCKSRALPSFSTLFSPLITFTYNFSEYGAVPLNWPHSGSSCDCFPCIPLPRGLTQQRLSQERLHALDCWVTFRGRQPLSPKKHNIRAVDCKRRNSGLENCGRPCLHGVYAGCSNAARLPQSPAAGVHEARESLERLRGWVAPEATEWMLGLRCDSALSVKAEGDSGLPWPRDTVSSQWCSSLKSVTADLRGEILFGQWLNWRFVESFL